MTGELLLPLLLTGAGTLVVAGLAKLRDPGPAEAALRALGLPAARPLVLLGAAVEVAAGAAFVLRPSLAAPALALLYAGFAAVVRLQLRRGVALSCGCLGSREIPPSPLHLLLNLVFAAAAAAAAWAPPAGLLDLVGRSPATGLLVAGAALAGTWLTVVALVLLPSLLTAYRRPA